MQVISFLSKLTLLVMTAADWWCLQISVSPLGPRLRYVSQPYEYYVMCVKWHIQSINQNLFSEQ